MVQLVSALQMVCFALIFFGHHLLPALGIQQVPEMLQNAQQNKFAAAMGIWFIGNTLAGSLISTGAFEVYFDGQLVRSLLQSFTCLFGLWHGACRSSSWRLQCSCVLPSFASEIVFVICCETAADCCGYDTALPMHLLSSSFPPCTTPPAQRPLRQPHMTLSLQLFSKLAEGRMPTVPELLQKMGAAIDAISSQIR
jgi:hypothetical protein